MEKAKVFFKGEPAGEIIKTNLGEYIFEYEDTYFSDPAKKAISLTLPKTRKVYHSKTLFPFFFNLLSEGLNKQLQCRQLQIDEKDYFSLLLATSGVDTIGAVTIKAIKS